MIDIILHHTLNTVWALFALLINLLACTVKAVYGLLVIWTFSNIILLLCIIYFLPNLLDFILWFTCAISLPFLQIPRIHNLKPSRGPVSGGTIVNITGSHLDAGSNVSIMFKDQPCTYLRLAGNKPELTLPVTLKQLIKSSVKVNVRLVTKNEF